MPDATPITDVAIVGGTGALGFGLSLRLAASPQEAPLTLRIGSRDPARAEEAVQRLRAALPDTTATLSAGDNQQAAKGAPLVIICVPFRNHSETFTNLKTTLEPGQLVLDATVPLAAAVSGKATRLLGVWQGSAAEQAQEMVPDGVSVLAGLHTVSAASLGDLAHPLDEDVLLTGDRKAEKAQVGELIERIAGLRVIDAGKLEQSRLIEALTPLLIGINVRYRAHAGIRITGL